VLSRGWQEERRTFPSELDVGAFDFGPFAGAQERVHAQGIQIRTLRELNGDPECLRKLYALSLEIRQDIPAVTPPSHQSYEDWHARAVNYPGFRADGCLIALDGQEYAGFLLPMDSNEGDGRLRLVTTGVRRAYRRRGIALALKLGNIAWARREGYRWIRTSNDSMNRAMLSINERLGFVRLPAWIHLVQVPGGGEAGGPSESSSGSAG
jgi:GNAT superfamily N-acetyltransferase